MKKALYLVFIIIAGVFVSCEDGADNIIIIPGGDESQDTTQTGDDTDTTATNIPDDWNLFQSYACYDDLAANDLNILTWNIEWFPKRSSNTLSRLAELINNSNADLIAMQEIAEPSQLATLRELLPGWNFKYYNVRGDQELAYFYKESEISSITDLSIIFPDNTSAFYRPPVITTIKHISGQEVTLFNIHLKCCSGAENVARRREASELLKAHIDNNYANQKVIVLGDFNDDIEKSDTPFSNFIEDKDGYYFADMEIANGSNQYWSYPSFGTTGSHIDHILITDELFESVKSVSTLAFDNCINSYDYYISDHRPVMITLE